MNAICDGFYNANSQQKMLELNETKDKLLSLIAQEERKEKKELSIAEVKKFLRGYEKYTDGSMESKKRLFDLFVKDMDALTNLSSLNDLKDNLLLIVGTEDHTFINGIKKKFNTLKSSKLKILEECGHVCNIQKWKEFNEVSLRFIEEIA